MTDDADPDPDTDPDATSVLQPDEDRTRLIVREVLPELQIGQVLRDRFVIEGKLGEGGMGQVFLARDRQAEKTHPHVALKVLGASFKDHPHAFAALRREATQSRTLTHPNIVAVFDFDRAGDSVYMVMEYLKGQSLDVLISNRPQGSRLQDVWTYVEGIGRGLEYVHRKNIVHADVKPRNILVTENGDVKILDLGIARTLDENQLAAGTTTRFDPAVLGALTPQYASPEMFEGLEPRPQDDLFALGCITYELLTGQHPYERRSAIEARAMGLEPKRPSGLRNRQWSALRKALAFGRAERPATADEFLQGMSPKRASGSPWPWIAVAAVLVIALTTQMWMQYGVSDEELVAMLLEQHPLESASVATSQEAATWAKQGEEMHAMGREQLALKEYDYALALLTDPATSAWRSYELVLRHAPDETSRQTAGENSLLLVRDLKEAAALVPAAPQDLPLRLRLVCSGLEIVQEPELMDVLLDVAATDISAVRSVPGCVRLLERKGIE